MNLTKYAFAVTNVFMKRILCSNIMHIIQWPLQAKETNVCHLRQTRRYNTQKKINLRFCTQ